MKNNILALWNFPPLCCWRLLSVLLRTFFFKFFCFFFFFFDRTLVSVDALGRLLGSKPELKRTHVETNVPRKLTVTARTISSPPHKAQIVSEGESQGRHLDTGSGFTRKHDRRGPNGQLPYILERQRRLPRTLRNHVRSALKKSLVANLSAKQQLSVAKLSAKRIFTLDKRDFLVANGRMAADFSSPDFLFPSGAFGCTKKNPVSGRPTDPFSCENKFFWPNMAPLIQIVALLLQLGHVLTDH